MRRTNVLAILSLAVVLSGPGYAMFLGASQQEKRAACAHNLSDLWKLQTVSMVQFGDRRRIPPPHTGSRSGSLSPKRNLPWSTGKTPTSSAARSKARMKVGGTATTAARRRSWVVLMEPKSSERTLKIAFTLAPGATASANVLDVSVEPEITAVHPVGKAMLNLRPVRGAPETLVNVTMVS